MFTENKIKSNISKSIISMIQTILLISHFDNNISGVWRTFTDGFQYFKFEFRFLNPVFFIVSTMNNKESSIPNRMYDLFFENKTAAIWFWNFLVIVFLVWIFNCSKFFINFLLNLNQKRSFNNTKEWKLSRINRL